MGIRNKMGSSLVEILVVLGIVSIVSAAGTSMLLSQQNEIRAIHQRAEVVELKNLLMTIFMNPQNCTWQVKDRIVDISSASASSPSPTVLSLSTLHFGANSSAPLLAKKEQRLPSSLHGLVVESILLKDFIPTGNPDEVVGSLEISFTANSRAYKPVVLKQLLTLNGSDLPSSKRIVACGSSVTGTIEIVPATVASGLSTWRQAMAKCLTVGPGYRVPSITELAQLYDMGHRYPSAWYLTSNVDYYPVSDDTDSRIRLMDLQNGSIMHGREGVAYNLLCIKNVIK